MKDYRTFIEDRIADNVDTLDDLVVLAAVDAGKDSSFVRVAFDIMIDTAIQYANINDVLDFYHFVMGVMPSDIPFSEVRDNVYDYVIDKDLRQTLAEGALNSEYLTFEKIELEDVLPGQVVYISPSYDCYVVGSVDDYHIDRDDDGYAPEKYRCCDARHFGSRFGTFDNWQREVKPTKWIVWNEYAIEADHFYTMMTSGRAPVMDWCLAVVTDFNKKENL